MGSSFELHVNAEIGTPQDGPLIGFLEKGNAFVYHRAMASPELPKDLNGTNAYLVGIKGTGMCALAELLSKEGVRISGSDVSDEFYTDRILKELGIPYVETFASANVPENTDFVIHSAAYSSDSNPELVEAERKKVPILKYTQALGSYSGRFDSSAIAGVHGKTTTTALAGTLARAVGLPARILAGSAVGDFGGRSTLSLGNRFFIAETCEYRKHFLSFQPRRIVLTSVESDHQDFFPTYESIRDAFVEFILLLPVGGELIYCADDPGAAETVSLAMEKRPDLKLVPYGKYAGGPYRIESLEVTQERTVMKLAGFPEEFRLRVPGRHTALDAAAALALVSTLLRIESGPAGMNDGKLEAVRLALENFRGSRRRSEIVGEAGGILVMDDYGHHPTAIRTTLEGLKAFYPSRRLVVSFMSHTYTRTAALLDEFASSFTSADEVILHKIYASAREKYSGGVDGRTLFERCSAQHPRVRYFEELMDATDILLDELKSGDLFLTMGAGDNWRLGRAVLEALEKKYSPGEVS